MRLDWPAMVGAVILVATFLYVAPDATALIDDHFMHVAWGRQLLVGDLPLRDTVGLGMPLQSALSAAAELAIGHRLLSEAFLIGLAFAAGAWLTFAVARRAAGSTTVGALLAVMLVAAGPRTYGYPKIVLYSLGLLTLWWYVDRPSPRRAAMVAVPVVLAFYLRHDHGLYLGLVAVSALALRHAREWRVGIRQLGILVAGCLIGVTPWLAYVQIFYGVDSYLRDLSAFASREYQQNRFEGWPEWPLRSTGDVMAWVPGGATTTTVGVRWSPAADDGSRRAAAARYGLEVPSTGPVESGLYRLSDISQPNVLALVGDPVVEDTAGLDRGTGIVEVRGLWVGPLRLFPALDDPRSAAALLGFSFAGVVLVALAALVGGWRTGHLGTWEHVKVAATIAAAVLTGVAFVREPLDARVADWLVAPLVLVAWCAGLWLARRPGRGARGPVRAAALVAVLLVLLPIVRSVAVVGRVGPRLAAAASPVETWRRLATSPPFDVWESGGVAKREAARYVRACSPEHERLLVLWFAPDVYYYADRPFAGRLGFYMEGYWNSEAHERANLARLERQRPLLALSEVEHEASDLWTYPRLRQYLDDHYLQVGEVTGNDGSVVRILARRDRRPVSTDPVLGWPCYR